jgi:hypothetical protein
MAKHTRNGAQLVYLGVTIMGVLGFNTGISFLNGRITFDMITVITLGFCCACMSLSALQDTLYDIVFAMLDVIANGAACAYLITTLTPYVQ